MAKRFLISLIGVSLLQGGCANIESASTSRLELIQERGSLKCGVSGKIPGFSFLKPNGSYEGLDVDICRAIAAALLGDPSKVLFRPLTAPERFTALKTGEVDILSRNTTMNLTRDAKGGNGVSFAPVVFHDGQGLMVQKKSKIKNIIDLSNKNICVGSGTTTEQNLNDTFQEKGIPYKPIKYQDLNQVIAGYVQGRCQAMTSDISQLAAARTTFPSPGNHVILNQVLSKEPLAPASIDRDEIFSDAIRWVIYSLISAEELGITKDNIDSKLDIAKQDENLVSLRRFLGIDGDLGNKLGLPNTFVVNAIRATGNYGEIYDRHLGPRSKVNIPRGYNNIYKNGGLLISPPLK